jgi:hypothetical protein
MKIQKKLSQMQWVQTRMKNLHSLNKWVKRRLKDGMLKKLVHG